MTGTAKLDIDDTEFSSLFSDPELFLLKSRPVVTLEAFR